MDVQAVVVLAANQPLMIETVQLEGPRAGEVLVEVKATGICHTDAYTLSGLDPEGLFPAILGHEGAMRPKRRGPVIIVCTATSPKSFTSCLVRIFPSI